jgi:poly(3-hydroxybutyrate) depolymerase
MNLLRTPLIALATGLAGAGLFAAGPGSFPFELGGHHLTVWHYQPEGLTADSPVLFVIHGVGRNAEEYRNDWIEFAEQKKFLLVAPEFSKAEFPGVESFNSGNLFAPDGQLRPREQWSYSVIEPLFDAVRARFGIRRNDYQIYGHSAGAQFVQRFLYFVPDARCTRLVAANAGWYMLPTLTTAFPYGLQGTPADATALRQAFARDLIILLGEADTDPQHPSLRHTPEADAQGLYRLARGKHFYARAQAEAAAQRLTCNWTLVTVPGVEHVNKTMAPFAVRHLFPE